MTGRHCPFLNRDDARCAEHFRVGQLQHAFEHCFSSYSTCPTYAQMLGERRQRRDEGREVVVSMTVAGRPMMASMGRFGDAAPYRAA